MTGQLDTIMMPVVLVAPSLRAVSHRESHLSRVKRCRGVLRMPPGASVPRTNLEIRLPPLASREAYPQSPARKATVGGPGVIHSLRRIITYPVEILVEVP